MNETRSLRVAGFSGALGDHVGAFAEAVSGEAIDVAIGDYLAEITMGQVSASFQSRANVQRDYFVKLFLKQLIPQLRTVADRGIKIVVNAGAFNPAGLAGAVREEVASAGVELSVAHVLGDDVLPRIDELTALGQLRHLDTGAALGEVAGNLVAANAYLGGWGIAEVLRRGADIVICGRVADASLVVGPAAWWHGWSRDDWDRLAGAVAAGHIIECGPQAMGGNFSGFTELPPAIRLGFPIAEIASDGSAVITKRADEAGAVTVDTVTAQLLYEIQGTRYLNPDVVLHVDSLRLTQEGPDRVAVTGAIGSPAPDTTKVGCFYPNGHRCVLWAFATGLDVDAKVDWLETQLRSVVETLELDDFRYTPCGQPVADPATLGEATIAIRIAAAAQDPRQLGRLLAGYSSFGLGGIPGFHGEIGGATTSQRVEYWPGVIRQAEIRQRAVLDDGRVIDIELPPTEAFQGQPAADAGAARRPIADEESCRVPLGLLAHARSGDKGGNSNLGVWARRPDAREWLKAFLTADEVHRLLACPEDVTVERFVLDEIGGVLFVLRNYFGASGTGNIGLDQIGKSVGEFLRAKVVDVPARLVNAPRDA